MNQAQFADIDNLWYNLQNGQCTYAGLCNGWQSPEVSLTLAAVALIITMSHGTQNQFSLIFNNLFFFYLNMYSRVSFFLFYWGCFFFGFFCLLSHIKVACGGVIDNRHFSSFWYNFKKSWRGRRFFINWIRWMIYLWGKKYSVFYRKKIPKKVNFH